MIAIIVSAKAAICVTIPHYEVIVFSEITCGMWFVSIFCVPFCLCWIHCTSHSGTNVGRHALQTTFVHLNNICCESSWEIQKVRVCVYAHMQQSSSHTSLTLLCSRQHTYVVRLILRRNISPQYYGEVTQLLDECLGRVSLLWCFGSEYRLIVALH